MIQEVLFKMKNYREKKVGKMDLLHRLPQIIVISACITSIHTQCLDESSCTCHCWNCKAVLPCLSCAKGWSGTTDNNCQRKNIAYRTTVTSTSTYNGTTYGRSYPPENAVDEDESTLAVTNSEQDPQLIVTLSETTDISHLYLKLFMDASTYHRVYVTNSSSPSLSEETLCASIYRATRDRYEIDLYCNGKGHIKGNQVVITRIGTGRLQVYEVKIYKCTQGTYGSECGNECRTCQYNRCNESTGVCEVGCKSGWYGDKCDSECSSRCASSSCDRYRGCSNCLDVGYSGPNCDPCSGNTYGRNCSMTCQNCLDCDHITGCQDCGAGFHGTDCTDTCEQGCKTASCEKNSGNCVDGCKDGYMGFTCADHCRGNCATCTLEGVCLSCVSGKFGMQCEKDCAEFCGGDRKCNKNTGYCFDCSSGSFGPNCTEVCSNNCVKPGACLRNGDCSNGCVAGWIGPRCDMHMQCSVQNCKKCMESSGQVSCEICNDGYYLDNNEECQKCPSNCISCENVLMCNQCIPGFKGRLCNEECNTNCFDGLCNIDGTCTHGCNNAKYGNGCGRECRDNCVQCYNGNNCTECLPGFYGLFCQGTCKNNCYNCSRNSVCESCKAGFYGRSCSERCPKECETCESPDRCSSCRKGWSGPLCQCSENCSQEACGNDGKCLSGCKNSFYGDYCNVTCPLLRCQKCDQSSGICKLFSGEDRSPEDVHDDTCITVPLAVAFALVCLVSFSLLGTTIYFRRQRNEERLRRVEEKNYVSANFITTDQEPHQYSSLQDISGPPRPLSLEGEGIEMHQS